MKSAIEILIVLAIITTLGAMGYFSFPQFSQRIYVERSSRVLALKLRTAQQLSLSPKPVKDSGGNVIQPKGYGIYLSTQTGENTSYIFFADIDGNHIYSGGVDVLMEKVALEKNVKVEQLKGSAGDLFSAVNIVYKTPLSEVSLTPVLGAALPGEALEIKLTNLSVEGAVRFIVVRTSGIVSAVQNPQITAVAVPSVPPNPAERCASDSNITNRWAWSDKVGWIDFCGGASGKVIVDGAKISGYATSSGVIGGSGTFDSFGIMALICGSYPGSNCSIDFGVQNDGTGVLSGWAWFAGFAGAENNNNAPYGWISFNCADTGSCNQSYYRVTIDQNGDFHGFAWSEVLGWISFNCEDTNTCLDKSDYKVSTLWRPGVNVKYVSLRANGNPIATTIPYNSSVTLTWFSQALSATADCKPSAQRPMNCWKNQSTTTTNYIGTQCRDMTQDTIFSISCDSNAVTDSLQVVVTPLPRVDIKAMGSDGNPNPINVGIGSSVMLTWSSESMVSCYASMDWVGEKVLNNLPPGGQSTGPQGVVGSTVTKTYQLNCVGNDGNTYSDWSQVKWK